MSRARPARVGFVVENGNLPDGLSRAVCGKVGPVQYALKAQDWEVRGLHSFGWHPMTSVVERTPSVLSAEDMLALDCIATELAQSELTAERRGELLEAIADLADKYTCDPRLTGN